mmetsp:Transcript_54332/g.145004  ORF Transcript_54332/g.145004 Transcript_54332/m.145004 type:complete len:152 (-) Transcript_54332:11-466(-)
MHTIREWAAICHPSPVATQSSRQQEIQTGPGSVSSESPEGPPEAAASEGSSVSSDSDSSRSFGIPRPKNLVRRRKPQTRNLELGNVKILRKLAGGGHQTKDMSFAAWRRRAMRSLEQASVEEEPLPASALKVAIASVRGAVHWGGDDEHSS